MCHPSTTRGDSCRRVLETQVRTRPRNRGRSTTAANWYLFLTGGLVFVLMIVRTQTEEEQLLARFGDSYRAYMAETGRFLPRTGANRRGA